MAVTTISSQKTILDIINQGAASTSDRKTGGLGKDDFLNLLVTQLKYQDPLQPTNDKEFIGQMAQFSSLEQMQNMSGSLSNSQAFSLIGKHVVARTTDATTKVAKSIEGDVTSVKVSGGKTYVVVNGEDIAIDKVTDVTPGTREAMASSNIANYTSLIGFVADGTVYDAKTGEMVGVNAKVTSVARGTYEDYAVMDNVKVEIGGEVTNTPSSNPSALKNYLDAHLPSSTGNSNVDNTVNVCVVDRKTGAKVPVTAKLKSYTTDPATGNITAILDQVYVPVESIAKISPAPQS